MKVALGQMEARVGDFAGNLAKAREMTERAKAGGAAVAVLPEFTLIGYPPRDLLLRRDFIDESLATLAEFVRGVAGIDVALGFAEWNVSGVGKPLYNALGVVRDGRIVSRHYKRLLPTYDVFDEARYFESRWPAGVTDVAAMGGASVGVTVCEDIWREPPREGRRVPYACDPVGELVGRAGSWVVNVSASPYGIGKPQLRPGLFGRQARRVGCPVVVVNQVGAQDELVFDGNSCAMNAQGEVIAHCREFDEDLVVVDLETGLGRVEVPADGVESVFKAVVAGVKRYVERSGVTAVAIGLSGGIDSAVAAVIAREAVGADRVLGVAMPGRYSSPHSLEDARALAHNIGVELRVVGIDDVHAAYEAAMPGELLGAAGENVQARIRGATLMGIANAQKRLVLATANKSELAVGYGTLYGDLVGALTPIGDLTKTRVGEMARWINGRFGNVIPRRTIEKPPSAELGPGQFDEDCLGRYEDLDRVVEAYVEREESPARIEASTGLSQTYVKKMVAMIDAAEFKRRQGPMVIKLTRRAFGRGRDYPIVR